MFTEKDIEAFSQRGISSQDVENQLNNFRNGFPFLNLRCAASPAKGIVQLTDEQRAEYHTAWQHYLQTGKTVYKFVPASGAASRMFKNLFEFLEADYSVPTTDFERTFFQNIRSFAFFADLDAACLRNHQKEVDALMQAGEYKAVVSNLLLPQGLNYGNLSKGLLKFHKCDDEAYTPIEEHLKEGSLYARNANGDVNVHFTVSPEHQILFEEVVAKACPPMSEKWQANYHVSFSRQKASTDTIAVDADNQPFREETGEILFRPAGHGALIANLNELDADIIFIKNIDNVVPDRLKATEIGYKKVLAGVLVEAQNKAFEYLTLIDSCKYTHEQLIEILHFVENTLCIENEAAHQLQDMELVLYLKRKLDRPFRVCGMVKNVGEPGGGPFIAQNEDGTFSPQILESSQIDMANPEKKAMFEQGTHFNPADLVCGVRDYRGNKFDLLNFVDKNTGFISHKSKNGRELKALELPGLWNGAMADWNTIFVEIPIETFNPVKTVNDLLRPQHQP